MQIRTKVTFILLVGCVYLILLPRFAASSWLISAGKFHISAHGRNSCQDCHEEVNENSHPNPDNVNKKPADFFRVDHCLSCHDNILEDLDQGIHGTAKIKDTEKYGKCLACHDPHYQPRPEETQRAQLDPERPLYQQCGVCHEERPALPAFSDEDSGCVSCHVTVHPGSPENQKKISQLCFHCHGNAGSRPQETTGQSVSLIHEKEYESTVHAGIACLTCHPDAAGYAHGDQIPVDCLQCHVRHDEKVIHDAHMTIDCGACHLSGVQPERNPQSKLVSWSRDYRPGRLSETHQMALQAGEGSCRRCHFTGNKVGAATVILPPKSILCMPCHAATFSIGDITTLLSLIVFAAGVIMIVFYFLSGSVAGIANAGPFRKLLILLWNALRTVFSTKIRFIIKALFLDVLLQRRLYRQSAGRWFIHSLIFMPFVFRFSWGIVALISSLWFPEWTPTWAMLNKNDPVTAFLFDFTGVMVILGVLLAFFRGYLFRKEAVKGLPKQDRLALCLISGIVLFGFVLEGMRIAMTGAPCSASYAFIGYGISRFFSDPFALSEVYGYIWYIHAILTGAIVAYMPFSRLLHIIISPVVLSINEVIAHGHENEA